jgi:hypothetical protein
MLNKSLSPEIFETLIQQAYNGLYPIFDGERTQLAVTDAEKTAGRKLSDYEKPQYNRYKLQKHEMETVAVSISNIAPTDMIEGQMAVQMTMLHFAALECLYEASRPEVRHERKNDHLKQAAKISKAYASMADALNRHRGKGKSEQQITVIHINDGAQAVIGNVTQKEGASKNE